MPRCETEKRNCIVSCRWLKEELKAGATFFSEVASSIERLAEWAEETGFGIQQSAVYMGVDVNTRTSGREGTGKKEQVEARIEKHSMLKMAFMIQKVLKQGIVRVIFLGCSAVGCMPSARLQVSWRPNMVCL